MKAYTPVSLFTLCWYTKLESVQAESFWPHKVLTSSRTLKLISSALVEGGPLPHVHFTPTWHHSQLLLLFSFSLLGWAWASPTLVGLHYNTCLCPLLMQYVGIGGGIFQTNYTLANNQEGGTAMEMDNSLTFSGDDGGVFGKYLLLFGEIVCFPLKFHVAHNY